MHNGESIKMHDCRQSNGQPTTTIWLRLKVEPSGMQTDQSAFTYGNSCPIHRARKAKLLFHFHGQPGSTLAANERQEKNSTLNASI